MNVLINNRPQTLPAGATLADALALLQAQPPFAAAINKAFVPRAQYPHTLLHEADSIEIIHPVTGG
ncbi:sulfur carrier protein [Rhodoferax ferrireducens]|uniref:Sulfur carrier protein n=1 Tax=Rhodoferax ferrireducens TaxID=192843 RepID=A0ABU2C9W7_9BURK|nr:sulfur carrier protein ThiS [Rhodoferax ferrireducens]MDR7378094.1 sulfur carrier protein [Rhodoferax ferrireducens]